MDEAGAVTRLKAGAVADDAPPVVVDVQEIEAIVARMARIPARQASSSDRERLRTLQESLERVVFGQPEAVHLVAQAIKRSRAGLALPERPAGCFLFTGPTGVGKTELAKQLALLLGNEFIRFDMSEYMEKHAVARLIGAPPGYVGFEQGGQLVDAVRTHPYSVVLLDEIEKAHEDIYNILLQVMDHATLTDNSGRKADFRNTVLILTSNAGSREMSAGTIGFADGGPDGKAKSAIDRVFSPEFRNRLDAIVTFKPLSAEAMETIVEKFVVQLESQLKDRKVAISLTPEARSWLAKKGYDPKMGARPLARVIQREVRDPLTDEILFGKLENGGTTTIGVADDKLTFEYESPRIKTCQKVVSGFSRTLDGDERGRRIRLPAAGAHPSRAISPTATASLISADAYGRGCGGRVGGIAHCSSRSGQRPLHKTRLPCRRIRRPHDETPSRMSGVSGTRPTSSRVHATPNRQSPIPIPSPYRCTPGASCPVRATYSMYDPGYACGVVSVPLSPPSSSTRLLSARRKARS